MPITNLQGHFLIRYIWHNTQIKENDDDIALQTGLLKKQFKKKGIKE